MYHVPARSTEMNGTREQNTNGEKELPFRVVQGLFFLTRTIYRGVLSCIIRLAF